MAQYEMNLRDYWLIVRRRRLIIIASTVLVMLFSFWFAKQKVPVYQATAAVKFEQSMALTGLLVEVAVTSRMLVPPTRLVRSLLARPSSVEV